jgi:GT2 family glycosyltransferase
MRPPAKQKADVQSSAGPSIAVVVPTWRRPRSLRKCLEALALQTRRPEQILLVVRAEDEESREVSAALDLPIEVVTVTRPGQVAALEAGLGRATSKVIAITDDDTVPHPEWLERLAAHYADPTVGGVGGRDLVHHDGVPELGAQTVVGRVQWVGRVIGNHHLGVGPSRPVHVLKGANMSFRVAALAGLGFDTRLRGSGAQVHNDLGISLAVLRAGWKLVYDPAAALDHHPAARFDEDARDGVNAIALENAVHNETLLLLEHFPLPRRIAFVAWSLAVGTARAPGVAQVPRLVMRGDRQLVARVRATTRGRLSGIGSYLTYRRNRPFSEP